MKTHRCRHLLDLIHTLQQDHVTLEKDRGVRNLTISLNIEYSDLFMLLRPPKKDEEFKDAISKNVAKEIKIISEDLSKAVREVLNPLLILAKEKLQTEVLEDENE